MSTQGERLAEFIKSKGLSQQQFGDSIGVSRAAVNKMITGYGNFKIENYIKFSETYNVSLDWLILGLGAMYIISEEQAKSEFEKIMTEEGLMFDDKGYLRKK